MTGEAPPGVELRRAYTLKIGDRVLHNGRLRTVIWLSADPRYGRYVFGVEGQRRMAVKMPAKADDYVAVEVTEGSEQQAAK